VAFQVRTVARQQPFAGEQLPNPKGEAKALLALLKSGATIEDLHQLIEVPPPDEKRLQAFAKRNPGFLAVLAFRRRVLEEFDRLAARLLAGNNRRGDHAGSAKQPPAPLVLFYP
jgi:hypothetical protein